MRVQMFVISLLSTVLSSCGDNALNSAPCTVTTNAARDTIIACPDGSTSTVPRGNDGKDAVSGSSCGIVDNGDRTRTIRCNDGSSATISDGSSCSLSDNQNGTDTIACTDGTSITFAIGAATGACTISTAGSTKTITCNGQSITITDAVDVTHIPNGSGVFTGNAVVANSADAAALAGYSEVTGSVTIATTGVVHISWPGLTRVGGFLSISSSPGLQDINLSALTDVGGYCFVSSTADLSTLSAPNLAAIGSPYLYVVSNTSLAALQLPALRSINGSLYLLDNGLLPGCDVAALYAQLSSVSGKSLSGNGDACKPSPSACTAAGLGCITDCSQPNDFACVKLWPRDAAIRTQADVDALATYEYIAGDLVIQTPNLANVSISSLRGVVGDVIVESSASLTSVGGLTSLRTIGKRLYIFNNASLTHVDLPGLVSIGDALQVSNNPALLDLGGMTALVSIGGDLSIQSNAVLASAGIPNLAVVQGQFYLLSNNAMAGTGTFPRLARIGTTAFIISNGNLLNLDGLAQVQSVGGSLLVSGNTKLQSVGLVSLVSVGALTVSSNQVLPSLAGLSALATVGGALNVSSNNAIASVVMGSLDRVNGDVTISGNPALGTCAAQGLIDSIGLADIGGIVTVNNNAGQCL